MIEEDQEHILEEHINVLHDQAFHMKKSLEQNNLRDALKFSSNMLGELKTSKLSPRNYFNLYMVVFDELILLEAQFIDE